MVPLRVFYNIYVIGLYLKKIHNLISCRLFYSSCFAKTTLQNKKTVKTADKMSTIAISQTEREGRLYKGDEET